MRLTQPILLAAAVVLLPLSIASAGPNGEFAGEWVFYPKKSRNTDIAEAQQIITLEGENVRVSRTVKRGVLEPEHFEFVYVTNGDPHTVVGQFEREVTAGWDGDDLKVKWTFEVQGFEVQAEEVWKKRRSGLEIKYKFKAGGTENTSKVFFVRPDKAVAV